MEEKKEDKKIPCPDCETGMDAKDTKKVFGLRDNVLLLLMNEELQVLICPKCSTTVLYDKKDYGKVLAPEKKIIV